MDGGMAGWLQVHLLCRLRGVVARVVGGREKKRKRKEMKQRRGREKQKGRRTKRRKRRMTAKERKIGKRREANY